MEQEKSTEQIKSTAKNVDKEVKEKTEQLANLENRLYNGDNFFYNKICKKIAEYNKDSDNTILALKCVKPGIDLTIEQFEILGCLSYLVGIDFSNQKYIHKNICEKVYQRFQHVRDYSVTDKEVFLDIEPEIIDSFSMAISIVTESMLIQAKEDLKNLFTDDIKHQPEEILQVSDMRNTIKSIFQNSIIPVNQAVNVAKYINTKVLTYEDIVKINSLVNRQCKYIGGMGVRPMIKLFQQPMWNSLLSKAVNLFDNTKFTIIYFDGILSLCEAVDNLKVDINTIILTPTDELEIDFLQIESDFVEKEQVPVEESVEDEPTNEESSNVPNGKMPYVKKTDAELRALKDSDIFGVIYESLSELLGYYVVSYEDLDKAIEVLIEKQDYAQNIYAFIKQNITNIKSFESELPTSFGLACWEEIAGVLKHKLTYDSTKYKVLIEKACQPIPDDIVSNIVSYVNSCINALIISTDEQKQTMISQLFDNGISTYKHLEEIMSLIEQCDINGKSLMSYVVLKDYLESTTNITEIFDSYNNANVLEFSITMRMAFKELIDKVVSVTNEYNEHLGTAVESK